MERYTVGNCQTKEELKKEEKNQTTALWYVPYVLQKQISTCTIKLQRYGVRNQQRLNVTIVPAYDCRNTKNRERSTQTHLSSGAAAFARRRNLLGCGTLTLCSLFPACSPPTSPTSSSVSTSASALRLVDEAGESFPTMVASDSSPPLLVVEPPLIALPFSVALGLALAFALVLVFDGEAGSFLGGDGGAPAPPFGAPKKDLRWRWVGVSKI